MRLAFCKYGLLQVLLMSIVTQAVRVPGKDHSSKSYFAVESVLEISHLLKLHPNWAFEHEARGLDNHYVFSTEKGKYSKRDEVKTSYKGVKSFHPLPPKKLHKRLPVSDRPVDSSSEVVNKVRDRLSIEDPLFGLQWHLVNGNYPGHDVNVSGLWYENITGHSVVVAVVDDGLDYESEDLRDNFSAEGSWDFNDNNPMPKPRLSDDYHGTRCAGEIAAVKNKACGVGVAYNAKVAGIRILSAEVTAEDEAASLIHALDVNDIYSCSWGPLDNGRVLQGPDDLVRKALITGVTKGRDEKGALYVFASGNGGMYDDNCNYDGYTNSIYSITVGAIDHKGLHPPYSESCSAVMVVTYSSGSGEHIHSTDINGRCSDTHGGTSAAAPLAAGVYSLVLEANSNLTWRDVQYLSILSSEEINDDDGEWQEGALGKRYSHKYGYGKLDAYKIVSMGREWKNVGPQSWYYSPVLKVGKSTNATDEDLVSTISISSEQLENANFKRVEHITVTVNIETTIRGQTTVDLISPKGIVSKLGVVRRGDKSPEGFHNWTFMSVAHWGEVGNGDWNLHVKTTQDSNRVEFKDWRLKLFGESLDASKAKTFEFGNDKEPTEDSQQQEESVSNVDTTSTAASSVTSTYSIVSTTSTTAEANEEDVNSPNRLPQPFEGLRYFLAIFAVGFLVLLLYYCFFVKSRRLVRRSRAEAYEFDIIDTDSDHDSSLNSASNTSVPLMDELNEENFDFDLSDEELLRSTTASPTPRDEHIVPVGESTTDQPTKDHSKGKAQNDASGDNNSNKNINAPSEGPQGLSVK
ncbi:LAQU0S08e00342g1_1 [Lachancea quebecensis]|uniref:LAQU0S08e00342g1_1 n=1 Tax=Lachancea quebecensis TaxID=1654605 RepID=A0A0P1KT59_9SACH|nr:LAQU0S08e00342g1_1 [Lachancea quebecensis]